MNTLSEAIREYQLCPSRQTMTRLGVCERRTGCPVSCNRFVPGAILAPPTPVIAPAPCRDTGKGAKRREMGNAGPRGPNKTELEYRRRFIKPLMGEIASVLYEAITFRLAAGFRYTPDWIVVGVNGTIEAHEAKGPWQSRDAYLRWCQAAQEWPSIRFFWGKREKGGKWKTEERNT